jgi:hypothetical protein
MPTHDAGDARLSALGTSAGHQCHCAGAVDLNHPLIYRIEKFVSVSSTGDREFVHHLGFRRKQRHLGRNVLARDRRHAYGS